MTDNLAAMYGLEAPARALCVVGKPEPIFDPAVTEEQKKDVEPEQHMHRFAVASANPRGNNSVVLLEYIESSCKGDARKAVECAAVFPHQQEVFDICASPSTIANAFLLSTVHPAASPSAASNGSSDDNSSSSGPCVPMSQFKREVSFFALPEDAGLHELRPIGTLALDPVAVLWPPCSSSSSSSSSMINSPIVVSRNAAIHFINFSDGDKNFAPVTVQHQCNLNNNDKNDGSSATVTAAVLDARGTSCFISLSSGALLRVDLNAARSQKTLSTTTTTDGGGGGGGGITVITASAHAGLVRRIVNSEGRLNCIVTCGDDGFVRGWNCSAHNANDASEGTGNSTPLVFEFLAHHHFGMAVAVNEHQPELAVSCGADRCTRLWRVPTLADESSTTAAAAASTATNNNIKAAVNCVRVSEHRDSVFSLAWSGPWVYASCSFDGSVTVDEVPFAMRSALLLQ